MQYVVEVTISIQDIDSVFPFAQLIRIPIPGMAESSTSTPVIQNLAKANVADLEKLKALLASAGANTANLTSNILFANQQLLAQQGVASAPSVQQHAAKAAPVNKPRGGVSEQRYAELLAVIEELTKDIKPTYAGNRMAAERLKKGIALARTLARDCRVEAERIALSNN